VSNGIQDPSALRPKRLSSKGLQLFDAICRNTRTFLDWNPLLSSSIPIPVIRRARLRFLSLFFVREDHARLAISAIASPVASAVHAVLKIIPSFSPPNASRTQKINEEDLARRAHSRVRIVSKLCGAFDSGAGHVEVRSFSLFGLSRQLYADPGDLAISQIPNLHLTASPRPLSGNARYICFSNVILFQFLVSVLWV
jgi:hypothetical protein